CALLSRVLFLLLPPHPTSTLFPYTTLFRSTGLVRKCSAPSCIARTAVSMSPWPVSSITEPPRERSRSSTSSPPTPGRCRSGCARSEEHTSELQSLRHLVCRLLLEKKKHIIP